MKRSNRGQSMVEYAVGLGCVTALAMVVLSALGFINWRAMHNIEHAFFPHGGSVPTSGHAAPIVGVTATPWVIE